MPTAAPLAPGPLALSESLVSMLRVVRAIGELVPAERPELVPESRDVSLVFLESVEESRGVTIANDVVALAVLRMPIFLRATGLHVAQLASVRRDCAGDFGAPPGWVEVASYDETAMRPDADLRTMGCGTLFCIKKGARDRAEEPRVRSAEAGSASAPTLLGAFLRERVARRYSVMGHWLEAVARAKDDARPLDDTYVVRVVDDRASSKPSGPPVRVRHKKFGEGSVVREIEGGKLEIAFDDGATRTLLRSFIEQVR